MQEPQAAITRTGKAATSGCRLASFYSQGGRNLPWFNISLETTQGAWGKPGRGRRSLQGESILSLRREGRSSELGDPTAAPTHHCTPNLTRPHTLHPFPLRAQTEGLQKPVWQRERERERLFTQV